MKVSGFTKIRLLTLLWILQSRFAMLLFVELLLVVGNVDKSITVNLCKIEFIYI